MILDKWFGRGGGQKADLTPDQQTQLAKDREGAVSRMADAQQGTDALARATTAAMDEAVDHTLDTIERAQAEIKSTNERIAARNEQIAKLQKGLEK